MMTKDIDVIMDKVTQFMNQEVNKYGNGRMDTKQIGDLADVIKDLSEAKYNCKVAETMEYSQQEQMGYTQPMDRMGYGQSGSGGGMGGGRQGYGGGMMGHTDPMQVVRDMMVAHPELRSQLRNELM